MEKFAKKNKSFVLLSILTFLVLMLSPFGGLLQTVNAATVIAYVDLTEDAASAPAAKTPATITTPPEVAISTADEFFISYVASTSELAISDTVTVVIPAGFASVTDCGSPITDIDNDTANDVPGTATITGNSGSGWQVEWTLTAATTQAQTGLEVCVAATTPGAVGNYSWSISSSNDSDTGPSLVYVGDDNDVSVTATVPATLSLTIKEPSTTSDTNACDLGILNPAAVNNCAYRIAPGTNNAAGLEVYVLADATLDDSPGANIGNDIDDTAGGGTIAAGTEAHGIRVTLGTGFTVGGSFSTTNDEPVPLTETLVLDATAAVDDSNTATWSTITHYASITTSTAADLYDQLVTYRAWIQT